MRATAAREASVLGGAILIWFLSALVAKSVVASRVSSGRAAGASRLASDVVVAVSSVAVLSLRLAVGTREVSRWMEMHAAPPAIATDPLYTELSAAKIAARRKLRTAVPPQSVGVPAGSHAAGCSSVLARPVLVQPNLPPLPCCASEWPAESRIVAFSSISLMSYVGRSS